MESDEGLVRSLAVEAGLDAILARLLVNRGVRTAEEARAFLNPDIKGLHDPSLLPDMDAAVERARAAIESGERICVHGDYDVDGITSTALLVRTLSALKANVEYILPHRHRDGYGIKPGAVDVIRDPWSSLIITCDCGITACDTVEHAIELGLDVIITDHHEPGAVLPKALAVINPKRSGFQLPILRSCGRGRGVQVCTRFGEET